MKRLRTERWQRGPLAWMAYNRVTPNLLMIFLLLGGLIVSGQIKKEVFPEFELDMVTVSVAYPGASPEEVEQGIILVIEEAVRGLDGIKELTARFSQNRVAQRCRPAESLPGHQTGDRPHPHIPGRCRRVPGLPSRQTPRSPQYPVIREHHGSGPARSCRTGPRPAAPGPRDYPD